MDFFGRRFAGFGLLLALLLLNACAPGAAAAGAGLARPTQTATATQRPSATSLPTDILPTDIPQTVTAPAPGKAACDEKTGSVQALSLDTSLLPKPLLYNLYLPPCYAQAVGTSYPVLYLLHGQGFSQDQWIRLGAVTNADQMISSGETLPFMMVFPLDPSTRQPQDYNFEQVFIQQLIPSIEDNYRTLSTPAGRAIGGISRGGAWALHLGLNHTDLFGAIGGHSSSIFYTDEFNLENTLMAMPTDQVPRIWLDAGDNDVELALIGKFEDFLTQNNIPHEWHQFVGAHDEKYWSAHVREYLEWYTRNWR